MSIGVTHKAPDCIPSLGVCKESDMFPEQWGLCLPCALGSLTCLSSTPGSQVFFLWSVSSLENALLGLHFFHTSRLLTVANLLKFRAGQNSQPTATTLLYPSPPNQIPCCVYSWWRTQMPRYPGGTHFSYGIYKTIRSITLGVYMDSSRDHRSAIVSRLSQLLVEVGGWGEALASQFPLNSLLR